MTFQYENLSGRPLGPFVSLATKILPGVAAVQAQVPPYACKWQETTLTSLASPGPLWVALGDSMTLGIGATSWEKGWVGGLQERLAKEDTRYSVANLAFSGARTDDVLERQLPALDEILALGHSPSLITLQIGSNDLTRSRTRRGLPDRFFQILNRLPQGSLVANLARSEPEAGEVNALLATVASSGRILVADMVAANLSWKGKLASDHFHPNDEGYAQVSEVFYRALHPTP